MNAKPNPNIDIVIAPRLRDLGGVRYRRHRVRPRSAGPGILARFSICTAPRRRLPRGPTAASCCLVVPRSTATRIIWWNFVSSDTDRLEAAKTRWKSGGFDILPGDEAEFIPLPEV